MRWAILSLVAVLGVTFVGDVPSVTSIAGRQSVAAEQTAQEAKPQQSKPKRQAKPKQAETLQLQVDCPPEIDVYQLHEIAIATNAEHTRVRVRRGLFDVVNVRQLHSELEGITEFGWTGEPGEYLIEIDVFDQRFGIGGELKKVTVIGDKPNPPPTNGGPQPPPGSDLSALAASWLQSVPQQHRNDASKAAEVMRDFASGHTKYKTFSDMQAAFSMSLGNVLSPNVAAWGSFGNSMEAEAAKRGVDSTAKFAEFLSQVAEGISS